MSLAEEADFSLDLSGYSLAPQGCRSKTYWNDNFVLQRRSIEKWERWQVVVSVLHSAEDKDDLLLGLRHQYRVEEDCFWIRYPRLDKEGSPSHLEDISPQQRREVLFRALPDYLALDNLLASIKPEKKTLGNLIAFHPPKTEAVMRYGERETRALAHAFSYTPSVPYPEPLPFSFQHGELSLAHTILTSKGYRLIDWETLSWHERGRDLTHIFTFLLLAAPSEDWPSIVAESKEQITDHLGISEEEWRRRLYWSYLGEMIFWRRGEGLAEKMKAAERYLGG